MHNASWLVAYLRLCCRCLHASLAFAPLSPALRPASCAPATTLHPALPLLSFLCLPQGVPPDTISYNSLICCYEKVNMPEKALELFDGMAVSDCCSQCLSQLLWLAALLNAFFQVAEALVQIAALALGEWEATAIALCLLAAVLARNCRDWLPSLGCSCTTSSTPLSTPQSTPTS